MIDLISYALKYPTSNGDMTSAIIGAANDSPKYHIWGVSIDQSNYDPEKACTYTDDAVGMTPGSSDWDTLFGYKPCLFVNGSVSKYLNPNDYTKDIDGNAVDITTVGNDVMVEFPKMGYKITTDSNDNILVQVTDNPNSKEFGYKPFSRNAIGDKDYFYYGAYKGYVDSKKLYSSSGKSITKSVTRANFRTYANSRGEGYFQNGFYQLVFLQCLFLLKYKNRDSQSAVGQGKYAMSTSNLTTGTLNNKGLNYGADRSSSVKLFGIEDLWGSFCQKIDGLTTDASNDLVLTYLPKYFDDEFEGASHVKYSYSSSYSRSYTLKMCASTDIGFIPKTGGASSTSGWTDQAQINANAITTAGGSVSDTIQNGIFALSIASAISSSASSVCSRLMYV